MRGAFGDQQMEQEMTDYSTSLSTVIILMVSSAVLSYVITHFVCFNVGEKNEKLARAEADLRTKWANDQLAKFKAAIEDTLNDN